MNKLWVIMVQVVHNLLIIVNAISVPILILKTPFYICVPLLTVLMSPLLGGTYCMLNNLENYFREKAGMRLIEDRTEEIAETINKIFGKRK